MKKVSKPASMSISSAYKQLDSDSSSTHLRWFHRRTKPPPSCETSSMFSWSIRITRILCFQPGTRLKNSNLVSITWPSWKTSGHSCAPLNPSSPRVIWRKASRWRSICQTFAAEFGRYVWILAITIDSAGLPNYVSYRIVPYNYPFRGEYMEFFCFFQR